LRSPKNMDAVIVVSLVLSLVVVLGTWEVLRQRRKNLELQNKLTQIEHKISAEVEERLISHTKYCERVDTLVRQYLEAEEKKWRELLSLETCRIEDAVEKAIGESRALQESHEAEIKQRQNDNKAQLQQELEKTMSNFKGLLEQTYLEEYEKMRRNPPKPKKGPRKKIEPPQRYRCLDDQFDFCPPVEPEKQPEPSDSSPTKKTKKRK
jgi:hypothetical protein